MFKKSKIKFYSEKEEKINIISHKIGILFSIIALIFLTIKSIQYGETIAIVSSIIFGISLIILYTASTIYHSAKNEKVRMRLKVFDHSAIYALIAGTYTPFTLVVLNSKVGWIIFGISWGLAVIGITLKIFFTGRFQILSTVMYVLMGWIIVFAIKPLMMSLSSDGLLWLFIGGGCYTFGAVLYSIDKIKMNHAMFHILVLLGSVSHFIAVYFFVL